MLQICSVTHQCTHTVALQIFYCERKRLATKNLKLKTICYKEPNPFNTRCNMFQTHLFGVRSYCSRDIFLPCSAVGVWVYKLLFVAKRTHTSGLVMLQICSGLALPPRTQHKEQFCYKFLRRQKNTVGGRANWPKTPATP